MSRLSWDKFFPLFDESWHTKIRPFIESKDCFEIYKQLKESKNIVYPLSQDLWKAFRWTNYNKLRAIVIAQNPYHTTLNNISYADGLAFSTSRVGVSSPSLDVLFAAMDEDLGKRVERQPDLHYLAFQNVLLLNVSLTIDKGDKDSFSRHQELWWPFMKYLFMDVLDIVTGIPILIFGKPAQEQIIPYLSPNQPYRCEYHPAFHARNGTDMKTNIFSWASKMSMENNGEPIYWDYNDYLAKELPF